MWHRKRYTETQEQFSFPTSIFVIIPLHATCQIKQVLLETAKDHGQNRLELNLQNQRSTSTRAEKTKITETKYFFDFRNW